MRVIKGDARSLGYSSYEAKLNKIGLLRGWSLIRNKILFSTETLSGFRKIRNAILQVPVTRSIVFWGLYWVLMPLWNYSTT